MIYRLYFLYPAPDIPIMPPFFEAEGFMKYYNWLKELLADDILGSGVGMADMLETQPIFGNDFIAIMYFDFSDRLLAFDSFDKHNFVEVLDKMLEFTDIAPKMQGVYMADIYNKA